MDYWRRKTNMLDSKMGKFTASGSAAMFAYWIIWPFEVIKNLAQAENKLAGSSNTQRVKFVYNTYGIKGFYRGILPGS